MDFDMFLTSPRWEILQIIAKNPSSPVELAEKLGTTVSYISQQMRLLEVAGLVNKKRTGAVEKGKPRTLFSISNELFYVISLTKDFSQKKLIKADYHKDILKIWNIEDVGLHFYVERLYWKLQESIECINGIFLEKEPPYKIIIVTENSKIKKELENFVKKLDRKLEISFVNKPGKLEGFFSLNAHLNKLKGGKE